MNTDDTASVAPTISEVTAFETIIPSPTILAAIAGLKFKNATPVQAQTIPVALSGKDLIVQAKTGSGKTLAFVVPLLHLLEKNPHASGTLGLIITPTRELASQICEVIRSISQVTPVCLIGGSSMRDQENGMRDDPRIVVGTPGRIQDFIRQEILVLNKCQYFVLDEADEMLSMDFVVEIREILARLPRERQGIFISATITSRVDSLANSFLRNAERVLVSSVGEDAPSIAHVYHDVGGGATDKVTALADVIETTAPRSAIIFCNTKSDTELVEVSLRRRGFDARRINSNLSQKQRDYIMNKIRSSELRFLVGTDIAARGIDIEQIDLVVNYALPEQPEIYLHRTGRTGRAGRSGKAVSLVGPQDFGTFAALKKATTLDLKKMPLPTDTEVVAARFAHFGELLGQAGVTAQTRDLLLAKQLLESRGLTNPSDDMLTLVGTLCRFTIEHVIKPEAISLEDEIARETNTPVQSNEPRHSERSGRSNGPSRRDFDQRRRR